MPSSTIHHFGPDPRFVGGMASVLNVYRDHQLGGNVVIHPTWVPDRLWKTLRLTIKALTLVPRLPRKHIVHVHLSERGSFVREGAILVAAAICRRPTVTTIHGADFLSFSRTHPTAVALVLGRARAVVCLSEDASSRVHALLPDSHIVQIPNPAVVDEQSPPAAQTSELVLFAGEIGVRKGADVLLQAWPRVAAARSMAECVLVGPPTQLEVPAMERLTVRGPASQPEIRNLLRSARLVVLPSRAEAMPMALIEALGAGRPFIATPVGAIPELAQHGGVLVAVGDAEDLAVSLITLLSDPRHAGTLGARGQQYVRETRSTPVVDRMLRRLYDEVQSTPARAEH